MFVLVTYDVPSERTHIFRKLLRRHLNHIQQSVFHGNVTAGQLATIETTIEEKLGPDDSVYIFHADVSAAVECRTLGSAGDIDDRFT